jgi:dienelactone hydrolase
MVLCLHVRSLFLHFLIKPHAMPSVLTLCRHHRAKATLLLGSAVVLAAFLTTGCANSNAQTQAAAQQMSSAERQVTRQQALASVVGMPDASLFETRDLSWMDAARQREVLARLYVPAAKDKASPVPLVVFSHGIGGSREGYTYIGKYLAANGIAALHVQHVGSDRSLWFGNPLQMVGRLQDAAKESEAINRTKDVRFALDQVFADAALKPLLDAQRIAAAGHSYGANTTLLLSGARVQRAGGAMDLADPRIKAAVIISAPPFYGEGDPAQILKSINVPSLHITATGDEIKIPGYYSAAQDRVAVYEATAPAQGKLLAVFKEGSHSMFTDRLGTGGEALNPQVKKATRELMLAFFQQVFAGQREALSAWPAQHQSLVARYERRL